MSKTVLSVLTEEQANSPKPRKRLFEAGEMKLLVLHFIAQAPKFSYDIIKEVAALVGGNYKPSTGTICPTINYLEEQQYVQVVMSTEDRKQYHITQKGADHLNTQQEALRKVLCRFNARHHIQHYAEYLAIKTAMENLKMALRHNLQDAPLSPEHISAIANKINDVAVDITQLPQKEIKS